MRRIIHYIALAILTLVGPVEAMPSVVGAREMAQSACLCGCEVTSGAVCQCHAPSMGLPTSSGSGSPGSSCSQTNRVPCTSQATSTSTSKLQHEDGREGQDQKKRVEPRPWPVLMGRATPVSISPGSMLRREPTAVHYDRSLDHLAVLAQFRI